MHLDSDFNFSYLYSVWAQILVISSRVTRINSEIGVQIS